MDGLVPTAQGARHKALAGAGIADSRDASALNPAGIVRVESNLTASASFFRSGASFESSGAFGVVAPGVHENDDRWSTPFQLSTSWRTDYAAVDAIAFTISGGEVMRSRYGDMANPLCPPGYSGAYCGGVLGLRQERTTASLTLAKRLLPSLSFGIAPFVTRQTLSVTGVGLFAGLSVDPDHFSNKGTSEAWGGGVRGGVEWEVTPGVRLGLAGSTRTYMEPHTEYRGLLAHGADIDGPASVQAGIAIDLGRRATVMADYKRIWYGSIAALANASTNPYPFGSSQGPGFGWKDVNLFKLGAEWRPSDDLTLRLGYAYGTSLVGGRDADFNILTPSFVQHHISGGIKRRVTERLDLELAAVYGLDATRVGNEVGNPFRTVRTTAGEVELTAGLVYRFGAPDAPVAVRVPHQSPAALK